MKASKKLLAAMLTLGLGSQAFATTYVYITGAQAFGNSVLAAIQHKLAAGATNYEYAYTGTGGLSKAQQTIWHGHITLPGGSEEVIIKTTWNGSTAGIQLVANQGNVNFLNDGELPVPAGAGTNIALTGGPTLSLESKPANAAPADTTASTVGVPDVPDVTYPYAYTDDIVGAGGYVFVASKGSPVNFDNIAAHQARALYREGSQPLAFFTGSSADRAGTPASSARIYATGRDSSSGARILSLLEAGIAENGYGTVGGPNAIQQYQYSASAGARTLYSNSGRDGNTSNGNLATVVLADNNTLSNFNGYYVSYLPSLDAGNAQAAGARPLKFNGVAYTADTLKNGAYPIWAYERLFRLTDVSAPYALTTAQNQVLDQIVNQLYNVDATVLVGDLYVDRTEDGGYITATY